MSGPICMQPLQKKQEKKALMRLQICLKEQQQQKKSMKKDTANCWKIQREIWYFQEMVIAFYGCSTLSSVSLANGLQTIGNGAFAECINLQSCIIADNANIKAIGKDAFYNCRSLKTFKLPIGLQALGDCCFEGCTGLEYVDMGGGETTRAVALRQLGVHVFRGCSKLGKVEFPDNYEEEDLEIDMFEGLFTFGFADGGTEVYYYSC